MLSCPSLSASAGASASTRVASCCLSKCTGNVITKHFKFDTRTQLDECQPKHDKLPIKGAVVKVT